MQKSGFFNALLSNGEYDRKYNANDYCDNLAVVISNGVLRSTNDDLKVTASGMVVTVGVGRAWINGHYYLNDTPHSFGAVSAPIGGTRYDRVFLRLNKNLAVRSVSLVYQQGTAGNSPTKPAPVRDGNIYDIVLADIYVGTNATSVTVTDMRSNASLCGWVYSTSGDNSFFKSLDAAFDTWFAEKKNTLASTTLFKRYNWRTVLTAAGSTVQFNIPQYNAETCFFEVFINGILKTDTVDYNVSGSVITFSASMIAGTEVEVKCYKSIDGTGIMSVADEITELQNKVATLKTVTEYEYICNGVNDNVKISEIAQNFLDGTGDFAGAPSYAQMRLKVYGTCGVAAAVMGDGSAVNYYRYFLLGKSTTTTRKLTVDFTCCDRIEIAMSGAVNMILYGVDVHVVGMRLLATCYNQQDCDAYVFMQSSGDIVAENCEFDVETTGQANIGRSGTFTNCKGWVFSTGDNAYAFRMIGTVKEIRVIGGEYRCYTAGSDAINAVVYSSASDTNAVCVMQGVKCPTLGVDGYYQTHAIRVNAGYLTCTGLISPLTLSTASAATAYINGTIPINK